MKKFFLLIIFSFILFSCARPPKAPVTSAKPLPSWVYPYKVHGKVYYPLSSVSGYQEICLASWYGPKFHGKPTASGEIYNMYDFTAAHRLLPIGTYVLVTNLENGKQVIVRITDRGPFVKGRCIDLSYSAAKALGMIKKGVVKVKIVALGEKGKEPPNIRYNEFYLQVGAFRYYKNALKLKSKLEHEFSKIIIEPFVKDGIVYYRVQIYISNDLQKALRLAEKLKQKRFPSAFLVAK